MTSRFPFTASGVLVGMLLLASGCGGGAGVVPPPSDDGARTPPERAIYDAEPVCEVVLSPLGVLTEPTRLAAERWSAATGCDVRLGEGGAVIELALRVQRPDGSDAPGVTSPERDHVLISSRVGEAQRFRTVAHEVGHVLGADHTASNGIQGEAAGRTDIIDAEALEQVCATLPCPAFRPEVL